MIKKEDLKSAITSNNVLISGDDFAYFSSSETLHTWISNYTISFPNKNSIADNYTVIPHGSATLVYTYDKVSIQGLLFGPSTIPFVVGEEANRCSVIFIIEFQPAGLFAFTTKQQKELLNKILSFDTVNAEMDTSIKDVFYKSMGVEELILNMEKTLLYHLKNQYPLVLNQAMQLIIKHAGNITLPEITNTIFYSERHINRLFNKYLGLNMKSFSRLVRVNKAIHLLQNKGISLTQVYILSGFYDMPHFIKDFKDICEITPQEFRNNMSDFYSEIAKF